MYIAGAALVTVLIAVVVINAATTGGGLGCRSSCVLDEPAPGNPAAAFWANSNLQILRSGDGTGGSPYVYALSFDDEDESVFCAENHGAVAGVSAADAAATPGDARDADADDGMAALTALTVMEMTSPATEHTIELALTPGETYHLIATAFQSDGAIYRSPVYVVAALDADDGSVVDSTTMVVGHFGEAAVLHPEPDSRFTLSVDNIVADSAELNVASTVPVVTTFYYGETWATAEMLRTSATLPGTSFQVTAIGLEGDTDYFAHAVGIDVDGDVFIDDAGAVHNFTTPEAEGGGAGDVVWGGNVASAAAGATATTSSDWSASFAGSRAIDGLSNTQWSSASDGDDAFITVTFDATYTVVGVGFWTRTMGTSSQITRMEVHNGAPDGASLGQYDLPDAARMYNFDVPDTATNQISFTVVSSLGGAPFNTGAIEVAAYTTVGPARARGLAAVGHRKGARGDGIAGDADADAGATLRGSTPAATPTHAHVVQ